MARTAVAGLIIATGFFRHGVLLTPAAAAICRELMDGVEDRRWDAFRPGRFSPELAQPHSPGTVTHSGTVTFDQSKEPA